ncbi:AsnC family transcriptional regulator [Aliiruegeria haliotis]|uniref:AsnC family transcriptional regulator n=1 Tax=Aliiruegeria haliotis TaxID=1280846 RepID=A0A2T0RT01_9RHOB|nr:Lrp/AsnC family transcriptional regulator [Aliiruegeria haliotis]PRY24257.1 AsnC family transcriptional regulator [Aliiruegeria haliotis]
MLDRFDAHILREMQRDSNVAIAVLAERIGLSSSACHRRVKLLESAGLIDGYSARVNRKALGLNLEVFVDITLTSQSQEAMDAFERAVMLYEEILECVLTTGTADYILRIVARDVGHYDNIHRNCLARLPGVSGMQTSFALRSIKSWRGYPVPG